MIITANPDIAESVSFEWQFTSRPYPLRGAEGTGRGGRVLVTAEGYRGRVMHASAESDGSMIVR